MSRVFAAILLAVTFSFSLGAKANAVYDAGTLNLGSNILGIHYALPGSFTDLITFNLGGNSGLAAATSSLDLSLGPISVLGISGLNMQIYNSSLSLLGSGTSFVVPTIEPAGTYYALISGTSSGYAGGLYAAAVYVSAVPEPGVWGMLVLGLGLIALRARRNNA